MSDSPPPEARGETAKQLLCLSSAAALALERPPVSTGRAFELPRVLGS